MSSFLSHPEIVQLVRSGELRIAYYSVRTDSGEIITLPERRFVTLDEDQFTDDKDRAIYAFFMNSLEPDSMRCHVGPYALVEVLRRGDQRAFVEERGGKYIMNAEKAGLLRINPGEFVLIGTNEYLEFSQQLGASLFTNTRNTDIGLSHVSTLVDPSWHGIMQIGVSNPTRYTKQLNYLDPICILRFHKLAAVPPKLVLDRFRDRRPHYGLDWWILKSEPGREFFPRRKEYSVGGAFTKRIRLERKLELAWGAIKAIGVLGLLTAVIGLSAFLARVNSRVEDAAKNSVQIAAIEERLKAFQLIENQFHLLQAGRQSVQFTTERRIIRMIIPLEMPSGDPPMVVASLEELPRSSWRYAVTASKQSTGAANYSAIEVEVEYLDDITPGASVQAIVGWLIVHPRRHQ